MSSNDEPVKGIKQLELGTIICKFCNELIGTVPTNGVKMIYGVCEKQACKQLSAKL